jgi:hypothetical protein
MSTSIVRDMCIFTAGVACASVVAVAGVNFSDKEPITPQQFETIGSELLNRVADFGMHGSIEDGRLGFFSGPPIECGPLPRPTEPGAVDSMWLEAGFNALRVLNGAYQEGMKEPVFELGKKCRPVR